MMRLWLLTSTRTYSRAVVAADSAQSAKEKRPDGAFWRGGRWMSLQRIGFGWSASMEPRPAESLPWWPDNLEEIEAIPLGKADRHVAEGVWASEPSDEARIP